MLQETVILDHLTIGYRRGSTNTVVASAISHSIVGGRLTCLLGSNGVGKSTLLKTIAAFLPPLGGHITIAGRNLSAFSASERARTIGVVLTEKPDVRNMTVEAIVALGRSPYTNFWGRCTAADRTVVGEAMDMVGIASLRDRNVSTLSDGERQKVMIAKAIAQQTPVICLDEPTAYLDYPSKADMLMLLRRIAHTTGKTVFLSTHDVELALQLADTLWLMQRDRPIVSGSPSALAEDGSLSAFFDSPAIRFDKKSGMVSVGNHTA